MKRFFLFLSFLFIIATTSAQSNITKTIVVDGKQRNYIIHLPKNYSASKNISMIIALHGSGGKPEGTQKLYRLDTLADNYNYLVIYPEGIYGNWNIPGMAPYGKLDSTVDDVHFISTLIDTVAKLYKGDTNKVFVTGLSRGGKFSIYLGWKLNNRIRAIAPVCASIPKDMAKNYFFDKPIPVLLINSTLDPSENYNGGFGKFNFGNHTQAGFDLMPTEDLVKKLIQLDNCDSVPSISNFADVDKNDGCTAVKYFYKSDKASVEFIKVIGGGHTWAGSKQYLPKYIIGNVCNDFSAADEIFNFFISVNK